MASSFWAGVVHAATPGHGKTIAAAYIVGARGRPVDALILGIFVTLSHVSGIVLVGVLASLGSNWLVPARTEAMLALTMGLVVLGLGLWMLWTQRGLVALAFPRTRPRTVHSHGPAHAHHHAHGHTHHNPHHAASPDRHCHEDDHRGVDGVVWHSHGWGTRHAHRLDLVTGERPRLAVLMTLSIAGGILPDPAALAILLAALSTGRVCTWPRDRSGVQPRLCGCARCGGNRRRAGWTACARLAGQRLGTAAAIGDDAADHRHGRLAHRASDPPVHTGSVPLT